MRKKILSIYLAFAIVFLSVATSAVPVYASNSTNWEDYFSITYTATNTNSPYSLDFKSTSAESAYEKLSKDERKKVDYDAFTAISAKDQNYKYNGTVLNKTTLPDFITSIAKACGVAIPGGISGGGGISSDLQNQLTRISNSISASNRKFGGGGMSFTASSTNPSNFGLGKLTLSKDFINDLRSNIVMEYGYKIYPALPDNRDDIYSFYNIPYWSPYDGKLDSFLKEYSNKYIFMLEDTEYYPLYVVHIYFFDENNIFYAYDGYIYCLSSGTVLTVYDAGLTYKNGLFSGAGKPYGITTSNLLGVLGHSFKLFNNRESAQDYSSQLLGQNKASIYISNTTVNNDYSTTINKIYDYSSHDTYTTINNNVTQAIHDAGTSGITDEQYQKIVDEVMQKVQQEIDSKPDTGDSGSSGGGSTGGDTGNTGGGSSGGSSGGSGADSGENDTWLEKIYNRLGDILEKIGTVTGIETILEYLKQIAADLSTLKEGGMLSADMTDTNGLLKDIKKLLGTLIAVQAVGDIADLLADTVGDKINDYVDDLKAGVTEVADALQDVFPFSIPWDLMAILALFSAEAQAPVFDIPVNIPQIGVQHSIHVDLSEFESISVICRAFLSLSFAVGLMYLTIRITGGKDDD